MRDAPVDLAVRPSALDVAAAPDDDAVLAEPMLKLGFQHVHLRRGGKARQADRPVRPRRARFNFFSMEAQMTDSVYKVVTRRASS